MATRSSASIAPISDTDAHFRAWVQFVEDTLVTTGGWVVTADTGQTLPSAMLHPIVSNTKMGYRIYRMDDALQASNPVFVRLDYGSSNSASSMGIWPTIGTGSDGAGNITGIMWNGGAGNPSFANSGINSTPANSYGSASPSRVTVALCVTTTNIQVTLVFGIERTKDAVGNDTGAGLIVMYHVGSSEISTNALARSRYLVYGTLSQPAAEGGLQFTVSNSNPSDTFLPGDIGLGIPIPFAGVAQQPGLNWLITKSNDISSEGFINTIIYGAPHTYQQLGGFATLRRGSASQIVLDQNTRVLMRFD